jgi:ferredoxin
VDCFHEDQEMLVIDPEVCIDCGACIPECPVQAIYTQDDVPEKWKSFVALNTEKSKNLPVIT